MSQFIKITKNRTTITRELTRIDKVGIEFEGSFLKIPFFKGHFTSDSSVEGLRHLTDNYCTCSYHGCDCTIEDEKSAIGEWVSDPITPSEVSEWIEKCFVTESNHRCGGHVHVSIKSNADYMTLATDEFYEYMLLKIREWGTKMNINENSDFWTRTNQRGTTFNYHKFNARKQIAMRRNLMEARYSQLNFCYNNQDRHTVEFRFLPMFKQMSIQKSATLEILQIIEDYLELKGKPKPVTMRISV